MSQTSNVNHFSELRLSEPILQAVQAIGYETPTPIQQQTIPPMLSGADVLGHAPTGTGKTAAFALPILSRLDVDEKGIQALVLTPTRELAIQVAEAFSQYAQFRKKVRVLPVYGGQNYSTQIKQLGRGVSVVVGTPGRLMDHIRRGTLSLAKLQVLVLDEADEMLRMGFIDDVEWILEQTPKSRQMALFSATMPAVIRRIANKHLRDPVEITIAGKTTTASTIRQRYWLVSGLHKLDALTRILEAEHFDAMLVFVRTRTATVELAEKLSARGFIAAAMNGDMPQKQREQMVDKLKRGQLDILVATDVVARGLDVKRISHVINYDIPYDTEAYIHRIGRTGRAGVAGDAILFVTQRERRLLGAIEKATRQKIEALVLPSTEMVNNKRIADFKQRIADTLGTGELSYLQALIEEFCSEHDVPAARVSAALAKMYIGDQPLLLNTRAETSDKKSARKKRHTEERAKFSNTSDLPKSRLASASQNDSSLHGAKPTATTQVKKNGFDKSSADRKSTVEQYKGDAQRSMSDSSKRHNDYDDHLPNQPVAKQAKKKKDAGSSIEMERFRVEVGKNHGVMPKNLVGAIANEAGLDLQFIGRISIHEDHSVVELPAGMPKFLLKDLKRVWVCEQRLNISRLTNSVKSSEGKSANSKKRTTSSKRKPASTKQRQSGKQKKLSAGSGKNSENTSTDDQNKGVSVGKRKDRLRDRKNKGKRKSTNGDETTA